VIDGVMVFGDQALERAVLDQYFDVIVYRPTTFTPDQQEQLLPAIVARYQLADSLPYGGGQWSIWIPIR